MKDWGRVGSLRLRSTRILFELLSVMVVPEIKTRPDLFDNVDYYNLQILIDKIYFFCLKVENTKHQFVVIAEIENPC